MNPVFLYTIVSLGSISFILGAGLAFASKRFAVEIDPRVEQLIEILPGANCGGCGYAGCAAYAGAIIREGVSATLCAPGGNQVVQKISELLGLSQLRLLSHQD